MLGTMKSRRASSESLFPHHVIGPALLVSAAAFAGCSPAASTCVAGMVISCPCAGGGMGTQRCLTEGTYGECSCPPDAGTDIDGSAPEIDAGGPDSGEPDSGEPDAGPVLRYAGRIDGATSIWATLPGAGGFVGLEAGNAACRTIGGDHVCEVRELIAAQAAGELAGVAEGATAWLHRTVALSEGGVPSEPGPGGSCNGWTYGGNATADGEYLLFVADGEFQYLIDDDTSYDGVSTDATRPDLECGGVSRSILCCFPAP